MIFDLRIVKNRASLSFSASQGNLLKLSPNPRPPFRARIASRQRHPNLPHRHQHQQLICMGGSSTALRFFPA